jgi:hypothetical protein
LRNCGVLDRFYIYVHKSRLNLTDSEFFFVVRLLPLSAQLRSQPLLLGSGHGSATRLQWGAPEPPPAVRGPFFIILAPPHLQVSREVFELRGKPFAKPNPIALLPHGLMQPLAAPLGLRTLALGARLVTALPR